MSSLQAFRRRLVAGISSLLLFTYLLSLALAVYLIVYTSLGQDLLAHDGSLVVGAFFFITRLPGRINLLASTTLLLVIYSACFAISLGSNGGLGENLRRLIKGAPLERRIPNWLIVMPFVSSGLLLVVFMLTVLLENLGLPTGSLFPPGNPPPVYVEFYGLALSPVLEELTFRVTTLGSLVSARVLWKSALIASRPSGGLLKLGLRGFLQPDRAKMDAGLPSVGVNGWRGLNWSEWILLLLTSTLFGWAHLGANSSWEIGKAITAGLSGLVLGSVFLAYGAYSAILLHWFFNLYFEVFLDGANLVGGLFGPLENIISFLAILTGVVAVFLAVDFLRSRIPQ